MKTLEQIRKNVSSIKLSQRSQHTKIQRALHDILDYLESKPSYIVDDVTCKEVKPDGSLGSNILAVTEAIEKDETITDAIDEAISKLGKEPE